MSFPRPSRRVPEKVSRACWFPHGDCGATAPHPHPRSLLPTQDATAWSRLPSTLHSPVLVPSLCSHLGGPLHGLHRAPACKKASPCPHAENSTQAGARAPCRSLPRFSPRAPIPAEGRTSGSRVDPPHAQTPGEGTEQGTRGQKHRANWGGGRGKRGQARPRRLGVGKHSRSLWDRCTLSHVCAHAHRHTQAHIHAQSPDSLAMAPSHTETDTPTQGHTDGHRWGGVGWEPTASPSLSVSHTRRRSYAHTSLTHAQPHSDTQRKKRRGGKAGGGMLV